MVWSDGLIEEQRVAASHYGSHARLLSGPGTGKTYCLTRRILYLIEEQNINPLSITVLTFTRAAAAELRQRIRQELENETPLPQISTLHSFSLKMILRNPARTVLPNPIRVADDFEERNIIMEEVRDILNINRISDVRDLFNQMSADWEKLTVDRDRFPNPQFLGAWEEHREIYGYTLRSELVYQLKLALEQEEEFDFGTPINHLLVDEYQDLNPCDLATIQHLTETGAELYCAGDDDQSIYGFRYANPNGIRRFTEDYDPSTSLILETCRRCDENILDLAMYVAQQDPRRIEKELSCCEDAGEGEVNILRFNGQRQEANGIADICNWLINNQNISPGQILILLRSDRDRIFSDVIRGSLENRDISVKTYSNPMAPLEENEGRIFLCLLYLLNNRQDHLAWRVLLKLSDNNIGDTTFHRIYELARVRGWTYSEALQQITNNPRLIERRGELIQREFNQINQILDGIDIDNIDNYSDFIERLANDHINDEELRSEIVALFQRLIQQTEEVNLNWLLRAINVSLMDNEQDQSEQGSVSIMSMHQAKGLTADAVFIAVCEDEYIPGRERGERIEDERRLLYVSLTRARHYLFITHSTRRTGRQTHSGSNSGNPNRTLTRFLRGGPVRSLSGATYINQL